MNMGFVIACVLGIVFLSWLWHTMYHVVLACWRPGRAKDQWLTVVNAYNKRFFTFFKWSSPILLVGFSLQILNAAQMLVTEVLRGVAS